MGHPRITDCAHSGLQGDPNMLKMLNLLKKVFFGSDVTEFPVSKVD